MMFHNIKLQFIKATWFNDALSMPACQHAFASKTAPGEGTLKSQHFQSCKRNCHGVIQSAAALVRLFLAASCERGTKNNTISFVEVQSTHRQSRTQHCSTKEQAF
jgi:hypothetical protein